METITVLTTQIGTIQTVDNLLDLQTELIGRTTQGLNKEMRDLTVKMVRTGATEESALKGLLDLLDLRVLKVHLELRVTADMAVTEEDTDRLREDRDITDTATKAASTVGIKVDTVAKIRDTGVANTPPIRATQVTLTMADMMQATTGGVMAMITPGQDMMVMMDMKVVMTVGTRAEIEETKETKEITETTETTDTPTETTAVVDSQGVTVIVATGTGRSNNSPWKI